MTLFQNKTKKSRFRSSIHEFQSFFAVNISEEDKVNLSHFDSIQVLGTGGKLFIRKINFEAKSKTI